MEYKDLIIDCICGKHKAQKKLFEIFAPKMLTVCLRYAKNKMQAEDMLQEGMIKVFHKLSDYKQEGSFEGWIRKVMVNTCLDALRKETKHQMHSDVSEVDYMVSSNDYLLEGLMAEDLILLIQTLPTGYRTVFNLYALEGYSHKEIADQLGITESTSKSQYSRAKVFLQEKLNNERN